MTGVSAGLQRIHLAVRIGTPSLVATVGTLFIPGQTITDPGSLTAVGLVALWLDHEGKERGAGPRGSSAKRDDVDVVFNLVVSGTGLKLALTHSRLPWVPREVSIDRQLDPALCHVVSSDEWPQGTVELASPLDDLAVPLDASFLVANRTIKGASGKGRRKEDLCAALRVRRERRP